MRKHDPLYLCTKLISYVVKDVEEKTHLYK